MLSSKEIKNSLENKIEVIDRARYGNAIFEILEIKKLQGAVNYTTAMGLYFLDKADVKCRMVRITLDNDEINMEAGAFYYSIGKIESSTTIGGVGGAIKSLFKGAVTGESTFKPAYRGSGQIYLEPSAKHYIIMELNDESIIVDNSMYYCSTSGIKVEASMQKNISSAVAGGEGLFQIKLSGSGIVILESLIPESEITIVYIKPGESLKLDGSFAIARTEGITFTTGRSDKNLAKSMINGEGLLQTFTGEGVVWLASTEPFYKRLENGQIYQNKGSNN